MSTHSRLREAPAMKNRFPSLLFTVMTVAMTVWVLAAPWKA